MAIGSVPFPTPQAFSGGADFSPLANLGNVYQQAQDRQRMQAALAQMGNDPAANAQALIRTADPRLVEAGVRAMASQADRAQYQQQIDLARQKWEAEQEQNSSEYRTKQAVANGLDPKAPEVRAWIMTGQNFPTARVGMGTPSYVVGPEGK